MKSPNDADLWKKRLGKLGEQIVIERLRELGWEIEARNWRNGRCGEIDIIARDTRDTQDIYVFLEVKTRFYPRAEMGFQTAGFDAITQGKKKKIVTSARCYLAQRGLLKTQYRFDIVVVAFSSNPFQIDNPDSGKLQNPVITHVEHAIGGF